jgi:hypothetical protein
MTSAFCASGVKALTDEKSGTERTQHIAAAIREYVQREIDYQAEHEKYSEWSLLPQLNRRELRDLALQALIAALNEAP